MEVQSDRSYSVEIRRPRWSLTIASLVLALAMLCAYLAFFVTFRFESLFFALGTVPVLFALAYLANRFPIRRRGIASVRDGILFFDSQPFLERRHIRGVFPLKNSTTAMLVPQRWIRNWRPITIELASTEDAKAIVNDLKLDESHAAQAFRVRIGKWRFPWRMYLVSTTVMAVTMGISFHYRTDWLFLPTLIVYSILTSVGSRLPFYATRVRVGTDGLLVTIAWKKRFISHQAIQSVTRAEHDVTIHLASGESICCSLSGQRTIANAIAKWTRKLSPVSTLGTLFLRIENSRALFSQRSEVRTQLLTALKRDGRDLEAWKQSAAAVSQTQYRVSATPHAVLENIVEDSAVAPDVRIGAALVLASEKAPRVRIENNSAHPELHAAIDAAFEGDDASLERAISKMKMV